MRRFYINMPTRRESLRSKYGDDFDAKALYYP
jgi:hypothetical protein